MIEIIGILATLFVLLSFSFSEEKHIRIINVIGALLFVVYGLVTNALSVWLLNSILIIIHIYKLYNNGGKNVNK
ncbi:YgjV family protein [Leptotrichia sp. oral taxon 223]|uniref:YgjV family protein n=1 Tax=Leptotrichia sp. oral taxon 223 TaxID=712363 RepID=UPI0015BDF3BF|nr:YgjV family protein [Leptotrichia sp. oral taxon 223]NWO18850.1 YgjV family protein [Leptotrichia sp. oral taxon 223]